MKCICPSAEKTGLYASSVHNTYNFIMQPKEGFKAKCYHFMSIRVASFASALFIWILSPFLAIIAAGKMLFDGALLPCKKSITKETIKQDGKNILAHLVHIVSFPFIAALSLIAPAPLWKAIDSQIPPIDNPPSGAEGGARPPADGRPPARRPAGGNSTTKPTRPPAAAPHPLPPPPPPAHPSGPPPSPFMPQQQAPQPLPPFAIAPPTQIPAGLPLVTISSLDLLDRNLGNPQFRPILSQSMRYAPPGRQPIEISALGAFNYMIQKLQMLLRNPGCPIGQNFATATDPMFDAIYAIGNAANIDRNVQQAFAALCGPTLWNRLLALPNDPQNSLAYTQNATIRMTSTEGYVLTIIPLLAIQTVQLS